MPAAEPLFSCEALDLYSMLSPPFVYVYAATADWHNVTVRTSMQ